VGVKLLEFRIFSLIVFGFTEIGLYADELVV